MVRRTHPVRSTCLVGLLVAGSTSCRMNAIEGSGIAATEARTTGEFQAVNFSGAGTVNVVIGEPTSVSVSGDDNLLPYVLTDVADGKLYIRMERGRYDWTEGLRVEIVTPRLEALDLRGSADASVSGLDEPSLELDISGSGTVFAAGRADTLEAGVSGSGEFRLFDLRTRLATVSISGSGDAQIAVSEELDVSISGSGDVQYDGTPRVEQSISGSGSVRAAVR